MKWHRVHRTATWCALLLTVTSSSAFAQTCLGRPRANDVRYAVGGVLNKLYESRTALLARASVNTTRGFLTAAAGPQSWGVGRSRNSRWQGMLGISTRDDGSSKSAVCPTLRIDYQTALSRRFDTTSPSTMIEAGLSAGRSSLETPTRAVVWVTEVGIRHLVNDLGPGEEQQMNALVTGLAASLVIERRLSFDLWIRLPWTIPGALIPTYGAGVTVGIPRR